MASTRLTSDGLRLVVHEVEVVPCLLDLAGGATGFGVGEFAEDRLGDGDHGGEGDGALNALDGRDDQMVGVLGEGGGAQIREDAYSGAAFAAHPGKAAQGAGEAPDVEDEQAVPLLQP